MVVAGADGLSGNRTIRQGEIGAAAGADRPRMVDPFNVAGTLGQHIALRAGKPHQARTPRRVLARFAKHPPIACDLAEGDRIGHFYALPFRFGSASVRPTVRPIVRFPDNRTVEQSTDTGPNEV